MARIRKTVEGGLQTPPIKWRVGKYIRLSREDGGAVSESVVNQEKILTDELPRFFPDGLYEVVGTYVDDGTSGTTDLEREDFQRMVRDVRSGRINCIIVKNLSRAFRNSANQGRFLEEFIPLYHTRFISLYQPELDTFLNPEVVHSLEVSITGFLNEQYAYKTSCDVRRTFRYKRENGKFIGAFAPYGYKKDPRDKNTLLADEEAAQVVRDIFSWFVRDGLSKRGIARRLNELAIPNPTAYKRAKGFRYSNPHAEATGGLWSPHTVSAILQNRLYIGWLQQGKQRVISYKVHKEVNVPERDWTVVQDAVPAVVDRSVFEAAQRLCQRDTRAAPGQGTVHIFAGLLRCPGCGKSLQRTTAKGHVYFQCRTHREQSKKACGRHSIRLEALEQAVLVSLQKLITLADGLSELQKELDCMPATGKDSRRLSTLRNRKEKELDRISELSDQIYLDWRSGEIPQEQYLRLKHKLDQQTERLRAAALQLEKECEQETGTADGGDPNLAAFLKYKNIRSLTRSLLVELVSVIYVHEDGSVEIVCNFGDLYRRTEGN